MTKTFKAERAFPIPAELAELCRGPKEQLLHIDWDDAEFTKADLAQCLMMLTERFAEAD